MRTPRRQFLASGALLAGGVLPHARAGGDPLAALAPLVDALLPADGPSPGGIALGVHLEIRARSSATARQRSHLAEGCAWLDAAARAAGGEDFAALAPQARERIVERAARADPDSRERRFFETVRYAAMTLYWSDPRSWPAIGYRGPPQPRGFPDFAQPPNKGDRA